MFSSRFNDRNETLFLIDISSFIFRAFFAIRALKSPTGEPTNAVFGVASMLARLVEDADPKFLGVTYDSKEPSFREEIYTEYKANRSAPPDDLIPQFGRIDELVKLMRMHSFRAPGFEADDLIATLTRRWLNESSKHHVVIVTGDKDLMALVNDRVKVWDTMADKVYGPEEVEAKFGVRSDQIRDYLSLVGDSSDNVPGVDGIGPKGAVELIKEFNNLDGVLDAAKQGKIKGKKCETLVAQEKEARLSFQLISMKEDIDLHFNKSDFDYGFHVNSELTAFLKSLGFNSLVQKWEKRGSQGGAPETTKPLLTPSGALAAAGEVSFVAITTEDSFRTCLKRLEESREFGFDLETTSLDPLSAKIVGVAVAVDEKEGFYIPVGHREGRQLPLGLVLNGLRPLLENPRIKKIGQNLKYDWSVLRAQGVFPDGIGGDTMVAAYVLEAEGKHNLETLALQYLGYQVKTFEEVCGKGKDQITFDQVSIDLATRYSAEDAWVALKLWSVLKPKLQEEKLMQVFAEVDLPLVSILSKMELAGVCIDEGWLKKLSLDFETQIQTIDKKIQAYVGAKDPVNLNSPKQLAKLLFEDLGLPVQSKTKTGYSTDATVLEALAPLHEVPRLLLEYREIAKLKGTYVEPLPLLKNPVDGKIHTSYHQTVAATGRLSSSDPNLQNIPIRSERGKLIRRAFVASPGCVLLSADYSQIELRILAHMSGDKELVGSFNREEDVHQRTASEIYHIRPEEVTDEQRAVAKAINFGLMYGKTPFGLAQELGISRSEAKQMIDRYFERYSGVKTFLDAQIEGARKTEVVTTLLGRRRRLRDINSKNHAMRGFAERMAMNTPIQGTAADLIKLAMIGVSDRLSESGLKSKLILQVHDELLLDCPREEVQAVKKLVVEAMEGALRLDVPLKVNTNTGERWDEL